MNQQCFTLADDGLQMVNICRFLIINRYAGYGLIDSMYCPVLGRHIPTPTHPKDSLAKCTEYDFTKALLEDI